MVAAVLALLASLSWGTSDFLAGLEARRSTAWTAALGGQVVAALALIALLLGAAPGRPAPAALAAPAVGGAIGGLGVVLAYRALALVDMSVVSPIIAGAALVPVLWGTATGERPVPCRCSASRSRSVVMRPHLAATGQEPHHDVALGRPHRHPHGRRPRRPRSACSWSPWTTAAESDPLTTVTVARTAAVLALATVAAVTRPVVRLRGSDPPALLIIGAPDRRRNILFTSATTLGYLSVVGVLGWLNPAVTMVWASVVLRERLTPLRLAAAASCSPASSASRSAEAPPPCG